MLKVKKCNFIQLYSKDEFIIPTYQRGYVWKKNEWEDFFNDIKSIVESNYKINHFMGSILLMRKDTKYEIIDGQQRLITILLFIKAFEKVYKNVKNEHITQIFYTTLKVDDRDKIFELIINDIFSDNLEPQNESSKRIKEAFLFFKNKLTNSLIFGQNIKTDLKLYRVLLKLIFIEINIDENANPYLIFETLNARGVDLNISDLVKNHLVEKSNNPEIVTNAWQIFMEGLNEEQFEELFQFFYNSSNNKKRLLKEITGNILTDDNVREFLQKLSSYVQTYKDLSDITKTYPIQEVQEYIAYLNHLGTNIFKILAVPAKEKFSNREFLKLLKLCEVFIFRYLVIAKKDEKSFKKELFKIAQKINNGEITIANKIYNLLYKDFFIDDEEFENAFSYIRLVYSKRRKYRYNNQGDLVKYILYRLENYLRGDKLLSLIGSQTNDVSIEHICNESSDMSEAFIYRLGNYALMKQEDNNLAGNKSFIEKKEQFYNKSTYLTIIGKKYKGKNILKPLTEYNAWTEENIKNRQRELAKIAVNIWNMDGRMFKLEKIND